MTDHESLSSHRVRSPAQMASPEPQADVGRRLLTIDHGRANAQAGPSTPRAAGTSADRRKPCSPSRLAYWFGLRLSVGETRKLAPYQDATGLQVISAVLAGVVWATENADAGIVEADEIDFAHCLRVRRPCLGPVEGTFATRTPLMGRSPLFPQDTDPTIRGISEMSSPSSRAGRR